MKKIFLGLFAILIVSSTYSQKFAVSGSIPVQGAEGWDYLSVNDAAQQLFVSHGSVVNVVDLKVKAVIATIPDTKGVHGIAVANDLNKAFITDGKDNAVTVVNLKTFELIEKIAIPGMKPDAVLYDQFSQRVFIYNGKSNDATVLDAKTDKIIQSMPLGGKPEFSVTNGKGLIYVNIEDKNLIKVIDAITLKILNTWSIAPGDEPSGLAMDVDENRLFSVCGNKLMVIVNAETGKVIQTVPIGDGCDGVAYDAKKKLAFSSNGDGTITVVKETKKDSYSVLQTIQTQKGARTIALNKSTGQLYLPAASYGESPAATAENPHPRPTIVPGSFKILIISQL